MAQGYRIRGVTNAFPKAAAITSGTRIKGQLIHITNAGEATTTSDDLYYPLVENFDGATDSVASVQINGIAKVQVETFTSIVAGSPLKLGATGVGVMLAAAGDAFFAKALKPATVNLEFIPVELESGHVPE